MSEEYSKKNRRKSWIILISVIIITLLLLSSIVFGYTTNVTENVSLIVTANQIGLGFVGGDYTWFNSTDYTTRIVSINKSLTIPDPDTSNYSIYFNKLESDLKSDLTKLFTNMSINTPKELEDSINTTISSSVNRSLEAYMVGLGNDIVARTNSHASTICNVDLYKSFVHDELMLQIVPNITEYDTLRNRADSCFADLTARNNELSLLKEDYSDLEKEYSWLMWGAIALLALFCFVLYLDYGSMGFDAFKRIRWRKSERRAINSSTFNEPKPTIVKSGSELLKDNDEVV